jgi:uncharacterized protein YbbK (DUF523 family)/uncharacterized protein YbgA (DUF1722 family)
VSTGPFALEAGGRPRVGISACLLGTPVRYDGGHKRDAFLVETLGARVEWIPVCPEVEAGFGTPREPMRLEYRDGRPRARVADVAVVVTRTREDVTARLRDYATARVDAMAGLGLSGFVLKKDSPSCGVSRVPLFGSAGPPRLEGRGVFAAALVQRFPSLPVEDEGRLADPAVHEHFVERVVTYQRLRALLEGAWRRRDVIAFHTAHKLTLMAHAPAAYTRLGRLVASRGDRGRASFAAEYESAFMAALARPATRGRHANVLAHAAGYLRGRLGAAEQRALREALTKYRAGHVPLAVPVARLRDEARHHGISYLLGQTYLERPAWELPARNHV